MHLWTALTYSTPPLGLTLSALHCTTHTCCENSDHRGRNSARDKSRNNLILPGITEPAREDAGEDEEHAPSSHHLRAQEVRWPLTALHSPEHLILIRLRPIPRIILSSPPPYPWSPASSRAFLLFELHFEICSFYFCFFSRSTLIRAM